MKDFPSIADKTLCRPNFYSRNTTQAALRLIMVQIACQETHHPCKSLQKWPMIELQLSLSQIMDTSMYTYENWHVIVTLHFHNALIIPSGVTTSPPARTRQTHRMDMISSPQLTSLLALPVMVTLLVRRLVMQPSWTCYHEST